MISSTRTPKIAQRLAFSSCRVKVLRFPPFRTRSAHKGIFYAFL